MDTSKEYIEMCRKAVEIQELWGFREGDYYFDCEDPTFEDGGIVSILHEKIFSSLVIQGILDQGSFWLPRQDQLQDMWRPKRSETALALNSSFTAFLNVFNIYTPLEKSKMSMEQLWIAFVMHERWGKKWNGWDWE